MRMALTCLVALALCVPGRAQEGRAFADDATVRLHDLFAREWEARLEESPLLATSVGRHEYDGRLPSSAPQDLRRRYEAAKAFLAELHTIDPKALSDQDRVSYRIFEHQLEDRVGEYELGDYQIPLTSDEGFYIELARLPQTMTLRTVEDFENYIARLRQLPRYFGEQIGLMRQGLERGFTLPRVVVESVMIAVESYTVDEPEETVFWPPFEQFPGSVPESEQGRLRDAGRQAILEGATPAYRAFGDFMRDVYLPGARETLGAVELPNGEDYYRFLIRRYTSLDLSARDIHEIGLREVEQLRREMDSVMREVGFEGDFAAFLEFLRTDPRFYAETPEELLMRAAWIAKRMDGKLPALFGTLPRVPYTVEPVPEELAPRYTAGRYVSPAHGSTQPGIYWVNTHNLPSRSLYNLEALTLHEAVPGHHLQGALAEEQDGLPPFRRFWYLSAFGEGWGLYSEWLGLEAGFYTDPYSNFGRLTYAMWRACRLVIDTGVHAFGWTRQQAIDYLAERTALSLHEVETEIDRYISWPGQALSYKLGELTLRRLRREAEQALGSRFDVREFHDAVLLRGAVPLPVLEEQIAAYVDRTRRHE
ncbi:MAG: DUF885 domain-containing protein [Thermoanaerobaculia bacterium]